MTGIIIPKDEDSPVRGIPVKGGDGHSRCPEDGCVEVERSFKIGGQAGTETYLDAEIYHADRKAGGCGANWTADTKQGAERQRNLGREPRWLTQDAATSRTVILSPQSEAYAENYRRIFGHD